MGRLFVRLRQPAVIGEILGGIVLGPSLLGLLPGNLPAAAVPRRRPAAPQVIAQLGLVLFMFIVGLEAGPAADPEQAAGRHRRLARRSIALPFGLGVALAVRALPGADARAPTAHRAAARVRAVPRRRDVDHRVPGAGPDPHRTADAPHPGRRAGPRLRRDRRRAGLVAARGGGRGRPGRHAAGLARPLLTAVVRAGDGPGGAAAARRGSPRYERPGGSRPTCWSRCSPACCCRRGPPSGSASTRSSGRSCSAR